MMRRPSNVGLGGAIWGTTVQLDQTFVLVAGDASLALDPTAVTRDLA